MKFRFQTPLIGFLVIFLASVTASAAKPDQASRPLSERFAGKQPDANHDEVPHFQKHVIPLLGKLGCNGRACHGSFQGRGGFQLSLFGYDFSADHLALLDEDSGRVDVQDVEESLILSKPTDADMHEGGKRFDRDSWQYRVLEKWISKGAIGPKKTPTKLVKLSVTPAEIRFDSDKQSVSLNAVAHWQDGTIEDVTELCRFSSNDDSIAAIDEDGNLQSGEVGDTHVVVYYDNAVVPIPVIRPTKSLPTGQEPLNVSQSTSNHPIDQLVADKLSKLGIEPSRSCTDSEFIRRVSLDMTGILPTSDAVREFLDDSSPDKREVLIESLLQSPGYAAWWATRLSDWTGNSDEQLNNVLPVRGVATKLWYAWLKKRLDDNVPYDELVEGIVSAESREEGEDYRQFCENMTQACQPGGEDLFAERSGLPLYWSRRNFKKPEERAIGFAYTFLGVRIECAQCHKHPFDRWSKNDFDEFAKLFTPIKANAKGGKAIQEIRNEMIAKITKGNKVEKGNLRRAIYKAAREGEVVPFDELLVNTSAAANNAAKARRIAKKKGRKPGNVKVASGTILGEEEPTTLDKDPRVDLMQWLRSPENPYFAKAIVNRVWSNYFGIGIVDPSDDMNLANPPSNAPLLDYLASEFVANDFDLHWLHRTITTSDTYQRSAAANVTNASDRKNFSRHIPRRLPAEVVYDCVVLATGSDASAEKLRSDLDDMAIADGKAKLRNRQDFALEVFGQSERESNCDCDRSDDPSLLQSIYLRNDVDMYKRLSDKNGWVNQACKTLGVPGPTGNGNAKKQAIQRNLAAAQQQFLKRLDRFKHQSRNAKQRKQIRKGLNKGHQNLVRRMKPHGYEIPDLDDLIKNPEIWKPIDADESSKSTAAIAASLDSLIEEAYLRTLSRFPEPEETEIGIAYIKESKTPAAGLESLLWALVNTKEFIISH
ncbi:hypothetical protein LF1_31490 [Rubripirellula obstinata]|uniref:BIG2 domain-containing protein n=1 Tax=Rubripirellula obstinata TaxID=406547 RepID=A0A5B1CLE7_9BACT|nr:DUF1549 and DUF1553 domain-containing protein [Rubripirellula obstinata]KAA1260609.1 hypothetical protein LF1_31490 [Rubripirellula obstinata]